MRTREQVAATIDHAVLKQQFTDADVVEACRIGRKYHTATVCVRPTDTPLARKELKGSGVGIAVVVGFPNGHSRAEVKALEAKLAIEDGAQEIDMVMNIGKFKSGDFDLVKRDIEAVVAQAKPKGVPVKVILEICYLENDEIEKACIIARDAGADYVKTSTGFGDGPATPEAVEIMYRTVGKEMKVKAAGGIKTWETAVAYLDQGCSRLGISGTEAVLTGAPGGAEGY
ncbi:MAG: deoxyribose-phosphate aldolase [Spirochaetales bacterium]|nr:deoxyribose-phosphate aldolase [Spirochaetales bacterium]